MLAKVPIVVYNSFQLGPALGDLGKHTNTNTIIYFTALVDACPLPQS